uniref:SET domain-containing protein n=1 Tax=Ditylum brightwellii TaxID=49249 RepID=A0A7S4QLP6_9STRA
MNLSCFPSTCLIFPFATLNYHYFATLQHRWSVSIANNNTFTNHACREEDKTAAAVPGVGFDEDGNEILFSPLQLRRKELGILTVATRDLSSGDEIMMDYSSFRTSDPNGDYERFLKTMCNTGEGMVPKEAPTHLPLEKK